ncbi:hypothetical protein [Nocardiopsis aegyptia]|uniref:Uncharacterized protein n=1 Tax=Nocardiopsis aegyptia TaxID=220378 RepID=A0A7Z0JC92_9ACTN|nr:hypothetical protein [Nocardiopsis aegyptia]NYJ36229.1 hypothetical protein [Nocardiopsis aegyptia]
MAGLGVRGVLRAPLWGARRSGRPWWRVAPRLLPYLVPPALFPWTNTAVTYVMGGRYGTWAERFYGVPAEMTFTAVTAPACLAVVAARTVALRRRAVRAPRRGDHNGQ